MMSILKRLKNIIIGKHRKSIHAADDADVDERQKLWWLNDINYTTIKRITMRKRLEIYL